MSDKVIENNQVTVIGEVVSEFTYSHEVFGEGFYMVDILVRRLSNSNDRIPVMVSERLIDVTQDYRGMCMMISGQFRSYNRHEEQKNRLVLSVFAREIEFIEEEPDGAKTNHILLEGYMCKRPVYRKTPLGREIADLLLAVNRFQKNVSEFCLAPDGGLKCKNTSELGDQIIFLHLAFDHRRKLKEISDHNHLFPSERLVFAAAAGKFLQTGIDCPENIATDHGDFIDDDDFGFPDHGPALFTADLLHGFRREKARFQKKKAVQRRTLHIDCGDAGRGEEDAFPCALGAELSQDGGFPGARLSGQENIFAGKHQLKCPVLLLRELNVAAVIHSGFSRIRKLQRNLSSRANRN